MGIADVIGRFNEEPPILHFSLQGLLESDQCVAIDMDSGFLALLAFQDERAQMLKVLEFPPGERFALLALLEAYPYHCPYEVVLASLAGRTTEAAVVRARRRLQDASLEGVWDDALRPIRNTISRLRLKLREMEIDIVSILETGYLLSPYSGFSPYNKEKRR